MKKVIKKIFKLFGFEIISTKYVLHVPDVFEDQKRILANQSSVVIFDVGAHHGQTALAYNNLFEASEIYSFEPFDESFAALTNNVKKLKTIKTFNTALSNATGDVVFHCNQSSATNSILSTHQQGATIWDENLLTTVRTIKVPTITLDDFLIQHNITCIDILKIDTQGTEYLVLEGARKSIQDGKIKLIYMEILTLSTYEDQKNFDEILLLLRSLNFTLFNIYNASNTKNGMLRQIDALFVANQIQL